MRILAINCTPDLTYFTKRGLNFDVSYINNTLKYPTKLLGQVKDQDGIMKDMATPDPSAYLETLPTGYHIILVGWNPNYYGSEELHAGGYTSPIPLSNGAFYATVRQDNPVNVLYAVHELHHILVRILWKLGYLLYDYMDSTPVGIPPVWTPYYKNNDMEAIDGNYARTWNQIKLFLNVLNMPTVYIKRGKDDGFQTLGNLSIDSFTCNTLELSWKQNQKGISCIPKGLYLARRTYSIRMFKYTYEILNVLNRDGIRIHSANYYTDLLGCIALGNGYADINKDNHIDILNSRINIGFLESKMNKQDFLILIQ